MKNKFIILTLCFTIIFTNINLNNYKSYAYNSNNINPIVFDGGVISAPMLATVSALAVGTGILINNSDDIYDIGRLFYDYVQRNNELTWDFVQSSFLAGYTLINDVVHIDKIFSDIVKGFFDDVFVGNEFDENNVIGIDGLPVYPSKIRVSHNQTYSINGYTIWVEVNPNGTKYVCILEPNAANPIKNSTHLTYTDLYIKGSYSYYTAFGSEKILANSIPSSAHSFPYSGGYDWGKIKDRENEESIALPIPGNLDSLVGQGSDSFWDNTDNLVGGGSISLPGVGSPSIDVTDDVFVGSPSTDIPDVGNPSVPNEGIWATIKDFVISLVVPSDTFWTDTFNGFRDNFSKNFPMLDMSKFDSLAVGGKPFPNLYAYGSKIVDGDVINSIVDWLRPIIAGFIMICLMFFNYRKIYKLIRNTEPFGSIAQGSSDFRTGLSAPPINNGLDSNPMGNLRDTLFDMRNEILRRENSK